MADNIFFEFLHMEMVDYVYKMDVSREEHEQVHPPITAKDCPPPYQSHNSQRLIVLVKMNAISTLENMGFRVGQGLIERFTKDTPSFKDDLDVMKFLCKDFWVNVFRKQIDNLRTNHQGTYVLQDSKFSLLTQFSNRKQYLLEAPRYLAYTCGMVRGALSNLGVDSIVTAEVSLMPACKFQVVIQRS